MTRLHELERQAQADETVESISLWLAESVRRGQLTNEKLRLLAYVGYEPARLLIDPMHFAPLGTWRFFDKKFDYWQRRLILFGHTPATRCALAASITTLPSTGGCVFHVACLHCVAVNVQTAVETWLKCPCPTHLLEAYAAGAGHELWYGFADSLPNPPGFRMSQTSYTIEACAELMGEDVIRAAICKAMIQWCLASESR